MEQTHFQMSQRHPIRVLQPVYGGGFAVDAGEVLSFVLPGELVQAGGDGDNPHILHASPGRVAPSCVHFGRCGGCSYQHAAYDLQTALKREILTELLGGLEHPEINVHTAAEWGYRNRIRLRVESIAGELYVGYSRPGSNEFLPVTMCPIAAPLLWRTASALVALATDDAGWRRWLGSVAEVELFCLGDESRLQAMFFMRDADAVQLGFAGLCERLKRLVPELAGAGAELDPELSRRKRRVWAGASWGAAGLSYTAAGREYWVSRGAFFQVNRFLVDWLVTLACEGERGAVAWDLFAGVGLFTRELAEHFERVVAVEAGESAAADLAIAGRGGKGRRGFNAVRSPTLDFLKAQELQRERPELVVLDPPRAGLGVEGAGVLARIGPARLVYVSCDPVTLARDLAVLTRAAYRITSVDLVDLFPQTFHLETVVKLARR